jgi:hypothetical protein
MDILHREGMSKCKPFDILMSTSEKLSAAESLVEVAKGIGEGLQVSIPARLRR